MSSTRPAAEPLRHALVGLVGGLVVAVSIVAMTWRVSALGDTERWWAAPGALGVGALVGASLATVRRAVTVPGVLPLAIGCSALAVYGCVPETDQMRFVGTACALVVVLEVTRWRTLPIVWHAGTASLVAWAGLYGATGRPSALLGALFALLPVPLLAGALFVRSHGPRPGPRLGRVVPTTVLAIGSVAAVAMARTGGIELGQGATAAAVRWLAAWFALALVATGGVMVVSTLAGRISAGRADPSDR